MRKRVPSLESLSKDAISGILVQTLANSSQDSDLSATEEVCQVLASLDVLQLIADDVLDRLAEVCYNEVLSNISRALKVEDPVEKMNRAYPLMLRRDVIYITITKDPSSPINGSVVDPSDV